MTNIPFSVDESTSLIDLGISRDQAPNLQNASRTSRFDVAVVGPPESGKKALVSALLRFSGSRDGARDGGLRVSAVAESSVLHGGDASPVSRLQVDPSSSSGNKNPHELSFMEFDLREEVEDEQRLPWPTKQAAALVLCVDVRTSAAGFWRSAWPRLANALQIPTGRSLSSLDAEEQAPELRFAYDRVLILLTRADEQLEEWRDSGAVVVGPSEDLRAVACRIDPRRWLTDVLGFDLASAVRAQMRSKSQLAVGIVSCAEREESRVEDFGVAETLDFLLGGEAREPLEPATPIDETRQPWIELNPRLKGFKESITDAAGRMASVESWPRLFLKPPREDRENQAPLLARWLRLDSYSNRLLTKSARLEMGLLARLLIGVGVFEFVVWTLLFNAIFHRDVLGRSDLTWAALGLGILFAAVIIYLDRSFLVADPTQKGHRWTAAFRVSIVVLSAVATSLAVDLVFFAGPIEGRLHEERLRAELVARAESLRENWDPQAAVKAGRQEGNPFLALQSDTEQELQDLRQERWETVEKEAAASAEARDDRRRAQALTQEIDRILLKPESSEAVRLESLRSRLRDVRRRAASLEGEAAGLRDHRELLDEQIAAKTERGDQLQGRADQLAQEELERLRDKRRIHEANSDRVAAWMTYLRNSEPPLKEEMLTEEAPPPDTAPWTYRLPEIDLFERFRILFDLMAGRPPQWPAGDGEQLADLRQRFHLEDPAPCPANTTTSQATTGESADMDAAGASCEETAWLRVQKRARFFTTAYWILMFIAAVVPLTVLIIKMFLMPRALSCYYSLAHQAVVGDIDAVLVTEAIRQKGEPS